MRCEDFPACGHEAGCCPDYDEGGRQLNMRCTCGAVLPVTARYSICDSCMEAGDEDGDRVFDDFDDGDDFNAEQRENEDFERADEFYGHEDFGYFGYEGLHEE